MSNDQETKDRSEKEEKEEKDRRDDEKWSEKWARDPLGTFIWALIIIWAGVAFLLVNLGGDDGFLGMDEGNVWAWILAGAGVLIWIEVVVRLTMPAYRRPVGGRIVLGTILVMVGAGEVIDVDLWPLIIIAIGVALLLGFFGGSRRF